MDPPTTDAPQGSGSEEIEEVPRFDDLTRQRIAAEREKAMEELEAALFSRDAAQLRAAITRGRKFRLPGLDEAAKLLRKIEKQSTKQHKAEKRRGEVVTPPAAAREDRKGPEPKKHFYVEKQQKNMCRMHALNAFYQRAKLNPDSFLNLCREFERATGTLKGSSDYFYVEADGANILSFVVERDKRYRTMYFPPGTQADLDGLEDELIEGYFEFDQGHVWYVLRDKARWVVLDSRSGKPERVKGTGLRREFGQIFVLRLPQADPEAAARLKSIPRVQEAPAP